MDHIVTTKYLHEDYKKLVGDQRYDGQEPPTWDFNNDVDKPTFNPSLLVRGVVPLTDEEYEKVMAGHKHTPVPFICHSFIREGKIQFLGDCTHHLKNQTVDLDDVD
jgi:hypothetical protein